SGVRDCVAWLDRYWAGPRPMRAVGQRYFVVSGSAGGHPVLAELDLEGLHGEAGTLEVLLSAFIPGVSDRDDDGNTPSGVQRACHEGVQGDGCSLEVEGAGLVARRVVAGAAGERFEQDPGSVAALEGRFRELSAVAGQLRARGAPAVAEARQVI